MDITNDLQLEQLKHQRDAVSDIMGAFVGVDPIRDNDALRSGINPDITANRKLIYSNVEKIQNSNSRTIPQEYRTRDEGGPLGIDVRMETGTGKTYVYTRTMYELHREFGVNKFIVAVPGVAIRQGAKSFLTANYARRHFADLYDAVDMSVSVVTSVKSKGNRRTFPMSVWEFVEGDDPNHIYVLIVNQGMLKTGKNDALNRDDYDQSLLGVHSRPYDAIAATKPVMLLDEPHTFKKDNKAWEVLSNEMNPQLVIRFGATFPMKKTATKSQPPVIDYNNLVHNLTAIDSFNRGLIKGFQADYVAGVNENDARFKLVRISGGSKSTREVTFEIIAPDPGTGKVVSRERTLRTDEDMSALSPQMSGITVDDVTPGKTGVPGFVELSNGQVIHRGESVYEGSYSQTYQELMISQAVRNHLEIEWDLYRKENRIKALTLFFIDSGHSYRREDQSLGHLAQSFETALEEEIQRKIVQVTEDHPGSGRAREYVDYLTASLDDLGATHGGYFYRDKDSTDEEIKEKVDLILNNKREMISLRKSDGTWNTMRFIFSQWALRQGWDNPNVFQIAKLRSSGSEISKIQEVGRGLRLPVDEHGARVSTETFHLRYLIDFNERDFAHRLLDEVNADGGTWNLINISSLLVHVAQQKGMDVNALFVELLAGGYVDHEKNIIEDKREEFFAEYPEFLHKVDDDKIRTDKKKTDVKIRPTNFDKLRHVWETLNKKYVITLAEVDEKVLDTAVDSMLANLTLRDDKVVVTRDTLEQDEETGDLFLATSKVSEIVLSNREIPYGSFLSRLSDATALPVNVIHNGLVRLHRSGQTVDTSFFTPRRIDDLIRRFAEWFDTYFDSRHEYVRVGVNSRATALTDDEGNPLDSVVQGRIGTNAPKTGETVTVPDSYLYGSVSWDSDIEKRNIVDSSIQPSKDSIIVFGKIPRKSVRIPHYAGGTTSPDFMYVVKKDGDTSVNFVIESKGYDENDDMRAKEKKMEKQAKAFFDALNRDKDVDDVDVSFVLQMNNDALAELIQAKLG